MRMKFNEIRHLLAAALLCAVVAFGTHAQVDASFSHFWMGQSYYNPAVAGELNAIRLNVGSRMQWVEFKRSPTTVYFSADMPYKLLDVKLGVGAKAEYERMGLFTNTRIGAQLAWKRKIGKGYLSVGIQPGVFSQTFRGGEAQPPSATDQASDSVGASSASDVPTNDVSGTVFDANVGVYYTHPRFWVSLSVTHVTSPTIELKATREAIDVYEFDVRRSYYFMAGGNIPINNTLFEIQPSGMFALTRNFWTAEVAARLRYNRMLSIGAGYRYKDAVTAFIGVNLKDAFIGYAYDYPVTPISKVTIGSHEVFVTYHVKLDTREKNKNKQKSVRLM